MVSSLGNQFIASLHCSQRRDMMFWHFITSLGVFIMKKNKLFPLLLAVLLLAGYFFFGGGDTAPAVVPSPDTASVTITDVTAAPPEAELEAALDEDGSYTAKDELALYIHTYGHLPANFVTKEEARAAGWEGGGLDAVLPGMCIGGDRFGNREGLLPESGGRSWTECDVNTLHASSRGAERIVFSNDGLIYYTGNHYDSFELLYGSDKD